MIEQDASPQLTAKRAEMESQGRPTHPALQPEVESQPEIVWLSQRDQVRLATPSDAPAIFDLFERVYELSPWTLAQIEREVTESQVWLVTAGEESIACLVLQENIFEGEILQIVVDGAHRRQGLARLLLDFLPPEKDIFLEVRAGNTAARALYERVGFEQVGLRKNYYAHPVEDAILMRRSHE